MQAASKPRWQHMTALVSLGTGGAMTGFSLIPGNAAADLASPTNAHIRLLAQQQHTQPATASEAPLRAAAVNVAHYYLRMAQSRSPSEMEALIWQHASIDGVDHGPSCAAFASLTLEQAAQVVGQESWVTGGTSYPWPLHPWVDPRVDPNPASLGITSIVQDAQAHHRWHPFGDGYQPQPGDWVLFDGHVEVVTAYSGGVLHTIGGDSLPNFSVNAHQYPDPLSAQGVSGFVNNGALGAGAGKAVRSHPRVTAAAPAGHQHHHPATGQAAIPGAPSPEPAQHGAGPATRGLAGPTVPAAGASTGAPGQAEHPPRRPGRDHVSRDAGAPRQGTLDDATAPDVPGTGVSGLVATLEAARRGAASIPGLMTSTHPPSGGASRSSGAHYGRHQPPSATPSIPVPQDQQAFIKAVAKGAMASQRKYGIPAAVTIAQAIDESGWGQSYLATRDHNLFGIKGSGPAGSDMQPTQEVVNGQAVSQIASFRVYHSIAQSIEDHGRLLASGGPYQQSMTLIHDPNAFASSLTGVYATDPSYGAKLISLMQRYHLYRYDSAPSAKAPRTARPTATSRGTTADRPAPTADIPGVTVPASKPSRPHAARTPGPSSTTPASSAPTSPTLKSPGPPSPAPSSPVPNSPAPSSTTPNPPVSSSTTPLSPAPSSPAAISPTPGSAGSGPAAGKATGSGRTRAGASATRARAGGATSAPRAKVRGQAARGAGTPQVPDIPGVARPAGLGSPGASGSPPSHGATQGQGTRLHSHRSAAGTTATTQAWSARRMSAPARHHPRTSTAHTPVLVASRYQTHLPPSVNNDFTSMARGPLTQAEPLYRDIAGQAGIGWQYLAACDWMQCQAQPRHSPVHGEKLGTVNADGTAYQTKSAALEQCTHDLVQLARAVYGLDLTGRAHLSVRDLANVFAAFRWGALLKAHRTSAMEFPYSVAGLTVQHTNMRWPKIAERNAPDKPGARFRMPFGAVPVMLSLNYPATV
jgi:flagellum-specific peptidoglycan hydrolase FlgJ